MYITKSQLKGSLKSKILVSKYFAMQQRGNIFLAYIRALIPSRKKEMRQADIMNESLGF